jgi:hypothetical protein
MVLVDYIGIFYISEFLLTDLYMYMPSQRFFIGQCEDLPRQEAIAYPWPFASLVALNLNWIGGIIHEHV